MEVFQKICLALIIIGALNWGLVGLMDFNLVHFLVGGISFLERAVYVIVCVCGLVNIWLLFNHFRSMKEE